MAYAKTLWLPKGTAGAPVVTAARLNNMESGIAGVNNPPQARIRRNADVTMPQGWTTFDMDAVDYDNGAAAYGAAHVILKSGAHGLVCVKPGLYHVFAHFTWDVNANGARGFKVRWFGANDVQKGVVLEWEGNAASNGTYTQTDLAGDFRLAAGEYLMPVANQASGGNLNLKAPVTDSTPGTFMGFRWVSD